MIRELTPTILDRRLANMKGLLALAVLILFMHSNVKGYKAKPKPKEIDWTVYKTRQAH